MFEKIAPLSRPFLSEFVGKAELKIPTKSCTPCVVYIFNLKKGFVETYSYVLWRKQYIYDIRYLDILFCGFEKAVFSFTHFFRHLKIFLPRY